MAPFAPSSRALIPAGTILVLAALVAYSNSFSGPLIFDDQFAITDNPSIRHLAGSLFPPASASTGGRPLLNFTFALNYAFGGANPIGYHVVNLLIHVLAGLTLFGIVRRTLLTPPLLGRFGGAALPLALAIALLWLVHPLQTEAVTYITQRAESLMGLFYLLTLYCFIRACPSSPAESEASRGGPSSLAERELRRGEYSSGASRGGIFGEKFGGSFLWFGLSWVACLLGVMTKEIMVSAPLIVLLYDRTFVAGSFSQIGRRRGGYYLGLAAIWLVLVPLLSSVHQRSAGFTLGVTWWGYALTSCRSVILYLKLALWPHPLVFDYGNVAVRRASEVAPSAAVLFLLVAGTILAWWRWPVMGFAGAWFFVILAPASSVVPLVGQPMAEHRMYLSLAAVIAIAVLGLYAWIGQRSLLLFATAAAGLGWMTILRNRDYKGELAIWNDTVAKWPANERAHNNLGLVLSAMPGRLDDAVAEYQVALRLKPDFAEAHNNLGNAWARMPGRSNDAIAQYEEALRLKPALPEAHYNLGNAWSETPGRLDDAIAQYREAVRIRPDYADAHDNLGHAWSRMPGHLADAIAEYQEALRLKPELAEAHYNLGIAWSQTPGRVKDAILEYQEALRLKPDLAEAHYDLGNAWREMPGRIDNAIAQYREALRLKPDFADAHNNLGIALSRDPGRLNEAIAQYREALRLKPDLASAWHNLGASWFRLGNRAEAAKAFREEVRLSPDNPSAQQALATALQAAKNP